MLKLTTFTLAVFQLLISATALSIIQPRREPWVKNPLVSSRYEFSTLRSDINKFGCVTDVCFLLDGSDRITSSEFQRQKYLIDLLVMLMAKTPKSSVGACAIVHDTGYHRVSDRTTSTEKFLRALHGAKRRPHVSRRANLARGLKHAVSELKGNEPSHRISGHRIAFISYIQSNKIVVLSKGGRKFGRRALKIANSFKSSSGRVVGVAVGQGRLDYLKGLVQSPVRHFREGSPVAGLVRGLVADLCDLPCGRGTSSC